MTSAQCYNKCRVIQIKYMHNIFMRKYEEQIKCHRIGSSRLVCLMPDFLRKMRFTHSYKTLVFLKLIMELKIHFEFSDLRKMPVRGC